MRGLEHRLKKLIAERRRQEGAGTTDVRLPSYPIDNLHGLEINNFAVSLARVTLWMGHKLAADQYGLAEPVLPLVDLSNIRVADALKVEWPDVDAIIGNPPFNGSQHLRRALGDEYVEWLKETFDIGVKDYCVYWFRKAHDHLQPGERAGLVGTNSVSQNRARGESLRYIVDNDGIITSAVSTQKWPGDAKVHVSIVNWVKEPGEPPDRASLDGDEVEEISPELKPQAISTGTAEKLAANDDRCFQGPIPVGSGFIIEESEARALLGSEDADYREVVRPYLIGEDIVDDPRQQPSRWIIDFGLRSLEKARRFPRALEIVEERVRPVREENRRKYYRTYWWRLGEPRRSMREALAGVWRYLAGVRVGKRVLVCWCDPYWLASDATNVFAFEDDYHFGVLSSGVHTTWAWARSSTFKGDIRYTPTSVFATFPWPEPDEEQRKGIGEIGQRIVSRRQETCTDQQMGLTELYNRVDDGAYRDLLDLHHQLDRSIVAAYGWPTSVVDDDHEIIRRLLQRNQEIARGERVYEPFGPSSTPTLPL